jgi:hypothetical protein
VTDDDIVVNEVDLVWVAEVGIERSESDAADGCTGTNELACTLVGGLV